MQNDFEQAAGEFHVPVSVLMTLSYRQALREDHDGPPSTTGAYNVMGLTDVDAEDLGNGHGDARQREHRLDHMNLSGAPAVEKHFDAQRALKSLREKPVGTGDPRLHTPDRAAGLIDASPEKVKSDVEQGIRAGAALLARYQRHMVVHRHTARGAVAVPHSGTGYGAAGACVKVPRMYVPTHQNWWWTAHPAAH
ncbi:trp operon leader peptide [Streptomyces caeni]|uniref:Trp operon leader peptide n=1 Tax=Streptomyces caeni TaxID=2307231 RepID=A0ABW4IMK6_9ACTN